MILGQPLQSTLEAWIRARGIGVLTSVKSCSHLSSNRVDKLVSPSEGKQTKGKAFPFGFSFYWSCHWKMTLTPWTCNGSFPLQIRKSKSTPHKCAQRLPWSQFQIQSTWQPRLINHRLPRPVSQNAFLGMENGFLGILGQVQDDLSGGQVLTGLICIFLIAKVKRGCALMGIRRLSDQSLLWSWLGWGAFSSLRFTQDPAGGRREQRFLQVILWPSHMYCGTNVTSRSTNECSKNLM